MTFSFSCKFAKNFLLPHAPGGGSVSFEDPSIDRSHFAWIVSTVFASRQNQEDWRSHESALEVEREKSAGTTFRRKFEGIRQTTERRKGRTCGKYGRRHQLVTLLLGRSGSRSAVGAGRCSCVVRAHKRDVGQGHLHVVRRAHDAGFRCQCAA